MLRSLLVVGILVLCICESRADSVSFIESQKDFITSCNCDQHTAGKFKMRGSFFTDQDLSNVNIDETTPLTITVGSWSMTNTLGNASKLKIGQGSLSARFDLTDTNHCNGKEFTHGKVNVKANASSGVRIAVSTGTGAIECDNMETSAITQNFAGTNGSVTGTVAVAVDIGNGALTTNMDVPVAGSASVNSIIKYQISFELKTVKVNGKSQ